MVADPTPEEIEEFDRLLDESSIGKLTYDELCAELDQYGPQIKAMYDEAEQMSNSVNQKNFDSALTVILTEANLDGTRWAITKIQEAALREPDSDVVDLLNKIVGQVEGMLDRRTVELTGKYGRD